MHLLILHGPNLRLLGHREPALYGSWTLEQINALLDLEAEALGITVTIRQSNHEGQLVDWFEEYRDLVDGVIINPAAYTHTSIALLDAALAFAKPVVEVHLTEPREREEFRHQSYIGAACVARFAGHGPEGYAEALRWLVAFVRETTP